MSYFVSLDRLEVLVSGHLLTREGRVLPYISHTCMYVPPQRVGFLLRFGLKTSTDCPFWSGIRYGSGGNS